MDLPSVGQLIVVQLGYCDFRVQDCATGNRHVEVDEEDEAWKTRLKHRQYLQVRYADFVIK